MAEYLFEKLKRKHEEAKARKGQKHKYKGHNFPNNNNKKREKQHRDKLERRRLKKQRHIAVGRRKRLLRRMTPAECVFKEILDSLMAGRAGVMEYQSQYIFEVGKNKSYYYILDFFVCKPVLIDFEIDGGVHNERAEYDRRRDETVSSYGIRVVRYKNEQVFQKTEDVRVEVAKMLGAGLNGGSNAQEC